MDGELAVRRGGAGCRQCGRGRRAPPAGRSASAARPPASSRRTSSESGMLELEEASLVVEAEAAVRAEPAGGDDAVAGVDQRKPILRAEAPGRARRIRTAGQRGELAVGDRLVRTGPPGSRRRERAGRACTPRRRARRRRTRPRRRGSSAQFAVRAPARIRHPRVNRAWLAFLLGRSIRPAAGVRATPAHGSAARATPARRPGTTARRRPTPRRRSARPASTLTIQSRWPLSRPHAIFQLARRPRRRQRADQGLRARVARARGAAARGSTRCERERLDIPCVIGGEEVRTGDTTRR